VAVKENDVATP